MWLAIVITKKEGRSSKIDKDTSQNFGPMHMVWEGELKFTKRIVGEVDCFGPVVMNRFTPQLVKKWGD